MTKHIPLSTLSLKSGVTYVHPLGPSEIVHWNDPALISMIDFKYINAETVSPDESIDNALAQIKNSSFNILLVVNKEEHILGLISAEDLLGEKPLKAIQERQISRADIAVRMVMTSKHEVLVLNLEDLRHAKVAHIVETLRTHKQHYALVAKIDDKNHDQVIRGLFSSALLSKELGEDVLSDSAEAHSIAELQHDLHLND